MDEAARPALAVQAVSVGPLGTNCYLVTDRAAGETLVVDPGDEGAALLERIRALNSRVVAIVNTHGHWDHTGANAALRQATGAPLLIHEADASWLDSPPDRFLREGEELAVGSFRLKVIHTPGHTRGGLCLYTEGALFSGDTLFAESVGRTDLPGGSFVELVASIREKLFALPDETVVYPGHGPATSIGDEKSLNPYV
ncbi:MAG: MBL fold metallo-hydrolase [Chitinophagales bacterium]